MKNENEVDETSQFIIFEFFIKRLAYIKVFLTRTPAKLDRPDA